MDKLIIHILFLVALELNIVDIEKKKCNSCGMTNQFDNDQSFPMQTIIFFPNEDCIINSNVECHYCCITKQNSLCIGLIKSLHLLWLFMIGASLSSQAQ
jgi:hypothetical protein